MDTVTESDTAISMAQEGGLGRHPQEHEHVEDQAFEVSRVKKSESGMILDPDHRGAGTAGAGGPAADG
jgi:IMP dehydrogenase